MKKRIATWLLEQAELLFLKAHGWKFELTEDKIGWYPPDGYPFRRPQYFSRGHAVNAQKQMTYNPRYGGLKVVN
jgi:hypothetical protein